jgi:DNA-binding MarR family transcriptional regulator
MSSETEGDEAAAVAVALDVLPRLVRLLRQASANPDADPEPLTLTQYRLLKHLETEPRLTTELAARLEVTPATVSAAIDCLVRRGMVERLVSPNDRRAVPLRCTAPGLQALAAARRRQQAVLTDVLQHLNAEETGQLAEGLRAVRRALAQRSDK